MYVIHAHVTGGLGDTLGSDNTQGLGDGVLYVQLFYPRDDHAELRYSFCEVAPFSVEPLKSLVQSCELLHLSQRAWLICVHVQTHGRHRFLRT